MKTVVSLPFAGLRRALTALVIGFAPALALAGGAASVPLDSAHINLKDQASLQRGARNFVTYCLNCHNAQFMRWGHLTQIGLTEEQIKTNLIFNSETKVADPMMGSLDPKDAKDWFAGVPPDLSLAARVRGEDWLYTFLRSFYHDPKSPSGWNNELFKNVSMPHVLHDLQGTQDMVKVGEKVSHGKTEPVMKLQVTRAGSMSAQEYDLFVRDIVNYMAFMAEPARLKRTQLGVIVMFFLVIAFFAALLLKHEYWKDVR